MQVLCLLMLFIYYYYLHYANGESWTQLSGLTKITERHVKKPCLAHRPSTFKYYIIPSTK